MKSVGQYSRAILEQELAKLELVSSQLDAAIAGAHKTVEELVERKVKLRTKILDLEGTLCAEEAGDA